MTSADFAARYKLLKRLTESGVRSYNAQQSSTGRPVMVHFLDGGATEDNQARLLMIRRLDAVDRTKVVETIEVEETSVIVTQFLPAFETLDAWLDARAVDRRASAPAPLVQPTVPAEPRVDRSGGVDSATPVDFDAPTMKMRSVSAPPPPAEKAPLPVVAAPAPVPSRPAPAAPVRAPEPAPAPEPEMGEFTRMFRATPASSQAIPAPAPPAAAPPPPIRPVSPPPIAPAAPARPVSPLSAAPLPPPAPVRPVGPPLATPVRPAATATPPVYPTPSEQPRAPQPPAAPAPGEFTGVFQSRGSTSSSSPAFGGSSPMFGQSSANPPGPASPAPSGHGSSPSFGHDSPPLFGQTPVSHGRSGGHAPPPEPAAGRIFELALPPVTPAREPASDRIVPMSGYTNPPESATGMMAARQAPQPPRPSLFQQAAPIVAPLAAPSAPIANAPSQAQGPSEFTRVMKGMATPVAAASAGVVAAAMHQEAAKKAAAAKPSMMPLIIALNVVFFAAIGLILYVVFKR